MICGICGLSGLDVVSVWDDNRRAYSLRVGCIRCKIVWAGVLMPVANAEDKPINLRPIEGDELIDTSIKYF
jgi:hypothetical protein